MRILHVISSLDPAEGGPPRIAVRLAAAQAALGHDVHMLLYRRPAAQQTIDRDLSAIPGAELLGLHYLPPLDLKERYLVVQGRKALDEMVGGFDFVHLHSVWTRLCKAAATAADRAAVPYTILLNGMLDPWSLKQKRWKKKLAMLLGYRRMLNRAAFLHTGNEDEVRLIQPLRLRPPCRTIPNGIFVEEITPLPPAGTFYELHPELQGQPFVLFLGRLHYKKGLDYLADAFAIVAAQVPQARLVVAGPDDGVKDDFCRRVAAAGIGHRVHCIGPIYDRERLAALADAACFCLPSRQEGFSLAITEAIGCGLPAIISQQCHFPEVGQAGAGFVLPLDAKAFADAIVRVLTDAELRSRMSRAGIELCRQRYTWPVVAEQTIHAYQEFARGKPQARDENSSRAA